MKLRELQQVFADSLINGDNRKLLALVHGGAMSASERIAVYRGNMRFSLLHTLEHVYPVCRRILGVDYFKQTAQAYIDRHPSAHYDLNGYGESFAGFFAELLATRTELAGFPYLPDLAQLEFHFHAVYYAGDNKEPFDFDGFEKSARKSGGQIRFSLPHALVLMESAHPLLALWQVNQSGKGADSVAACEEREYLCIRRCGNKPRIERLDRQHYAILQSIGSSASLGQLAERFNNLDTELPGLIKSGHISSFTTPE